MISAFDFATYLNKQDPPRSTPEQRAEAMIAEHGLTKALQIALHDAMTGRELDNETRIVYAILWSK